MPARRPWLFDVALVALVVALVLTAGVLVTDLLCHEYTGQPNGCYWPWSAADGGIGDE